MRLLHVVPTYLPAARYGGPIQSVHGLCRALAARGHEVSVFTTNVDGPGVSGAPLGRPVDLDGVRVWYFPTGGGRRLYRAPEMERALAARVDAFDILHLHSVFLWPTAMAARLARRAGAPYVLAPRGMLVADLIRRKSPWLKTAWIGLFERANVAGAASIHATAQVEADEIEKLGFTARRIDVVANGVDLPDDAILARAAASKPVARDGRPVVLSLGRISWKKGLDRLIPAIARVPEADLVIAGNDEEGLQPALLRLAEEHGARERVRFAGFVQGAEKWALFRQAAVFALASYSENFGVAVLEAMAAGCPVVVTPEVGLARAVRETGAGVVAEGDPEAFGAAIAALVADPERRGRMGEAGRRAAREMFSWAVIAERMETVYRECAEDSGRRRASVSATPPSWKTR